ncbi:MAG: WD40 repeat domain-containing protein [Planctomycetia bacterium]|nr:WD40 repeat domain-containing protein [Planctomycetia bacterium]
MFNIKSLCYCFVVGSLVLGVLAVQAETTTIPSHQVIQFNHVSASYRIPVVVGVSLSQDGQQLITVGDDHKARVWDVQTGRLVRELADQADWVRTVKFRPDGEVFVTGGMDQNMYCYDARTFQRKFQFESNRCAVRAVAFSEDSERMAMVGFDNSVCVYETTYGRLHRRWTTTCTDQRCVEFSPSSHYMAAAGRDGNVRVFDTTTGAVVADLKKHIRRVNTVAFSPDGSVLATGGDDQKIHLWSMKDYKHLKELDYPSGKVTALTFCGDNLLAAGSANNKIYVWDIHTNAVPMYEMNEHQGTVAELLWDQTHKTLISCSFDTTVRFWKWEQADVAAAEASVVR